MSEAPVQNKEFIPEEEFEHADVHWGFSHFDGREAMFNEEGDHNFIIRIPEQRALRMQEAGWNVKQKEGREEGDPLEWHLKVKIGTKRGMPKIFFVKGKRIIRVEDARELADIRFSVVTNLDLIVQPSRWINGNRQGISAYVKEMYVEMNVSKFDEKYAELEHI